MSGQTSDGIELRLSNRFVLIFSTTFRENTIFGYLRDRFGTIVRIDMEAYRSVVQSVAVDGPDMVRVDHVLDLDSPHVKTRSVRGGGHA